MTLIKISAPFSHSECVNFLDKNQQRKEERSEKQSHKNWLGALKQLWK